MITPKQLKVSLSIKRLRHLSNLLNEELLYGKLPSLPYSKGLSFWICRCEMHLSKVTYSSSSFCAMQAS